MEGEPGDKWMNTKTVTRLKNLYKKNESNLSLEEVHEMALRDYHEQYWSKYSEKTRAIEILNKKIKN
jgi:hypothetical protein